MATRSTISTRRKEKGPTHSLLRKPAPELTAAKKESRLFSQNPRRYLENFVVGSASKGGAGKGKIVTPIDTNSLTALITYIDESKADSDLGDMAEQFERRYKASKSRTLLINMAGLPPPSTKVKLPSPGGQRSASETKGKVKAKGHDKDKEPQSQPQQPLPAENPIKKSWQEVQDEQSFRKFLKNPDAFRSAGNPSGPSGKRELSDAELATQAFLSRVKNSDIDKIILWINTPSSAHDHSLPYGIPSDLILPENLDLDPVFDEFLLLDAEYSHKLSSLNRQIQENYATLQSTRWAPKDSALLYHILSAPNSLPAPFRADLLATLFPSFSPEQVSSQKYLLRMKRSLEEKRAAIVAAWNRDKLELSAKIGEALNSFSADEERRAMLQREREDQLEKCRYWRAEVQRLRAEKVQKVRKLSVLAEPFEKARELRELQRSTEEEKRRMEAAQKLEEYKASLKVISEQQAKEKEEMEAEMTKFRKIETEYNQTRVKARQDLHLQKLAELQRLERLKQEELLAKQELLERSKYKVDFEPQPGSLLADTHSTLIRRYETQAPPDDSDMARFFQQAYQPFFSSDAVMADRRNRVEGKLREAGLIDSSYARQILLAMEPRPKPHLKSNIQFKHEQDN